VMLDYFELVTDVPDGEIAAVRDALQQGQVNPRDVKMHLARDLVSEFHSPEAALRAEEEFRRVFQKRELPTEMPVIVLPRAVVDDHKVNLVDLLVEHGRVESRTRAKELIKNGAVELAGRRVTLEQPEVRIHDGTILKVGKRRFFKLVLAD